MEIFTKEEFYLKILKSNLADINNLKKEEEYFLKLKEVAKNLDQLYNAKKNTIYNPVEKFWLTFEKLEEEDKENLYITDGSLNRWKITKEDLLLTIPWGIYYKLEGNVPDEIRKEYFENRIDFILEYLKNKQIETIWQEEVEKNNNKISNPFKDINSFQEKLFQQNYLGAERGRTSELVFYQLLKKIESNKSNMLEIEIRKTDIITDVKDGVDFNLKLNEIKYLIDFTINNKKKILERKEKKIKEEKNINLNSKYLLYQSKILENHKIQFNSWIQSNYLNNPLYYMERNFKKEIIFEFLDFFRNFQNISNKPNIFL